MIRQKTQKNRQKKRKIDIESTSKSNSKSTSKKKLVYTKKEYSSGDGMLTSIWGPSLWHYLHVISFNYPVKPTKLQKNKYKQLLLNLQYTLKSCYVSYPNIFITDLENGKIHRKRDTEKYSKHFRWKLDNYNE